MFAKVLLAVDGSKESNRATERAEELGRELGSEILVVHVRERVPARGGLHDVDVTEEDVDIAQQSAAALQAAGVNARPLRVTGFYGHTPKMIAEAASEFGAEVIVIGSRGRSDLPSLLLGSVTHKLLHLTDIPVLVIS